MAWVGRLMIGVMLLLAPAGCGDTDRDETAPVITVDRIPTPVLEEVATLTGTVDSPVTMEAKVGAAEVPASDIEVADGTWSIVLNSFPLGTRIVEISAADEAENVTIVRFSLRRPAVLLGPLPRVNPSSLQMLTGWKRPEVTVTVDNQDVFEEETLSVDGMTWQKWSYELPEPDAGSRGVAVRARDEGGNLLETLTETLTVNSAAPLVTFDDLPLIVTTESLDLTGTVEEGADLTVTVLRPGEQEPETLMPGIGGGAWTVAGVNLMPGTNRFVATAAGEEGTGQAVVDVIFLEPAE